MNYPTKEQLDDYYVELQKAAEELGAELTAIRQASESLAECEHVPRRTLVDLDGAREAVAWKLRELAVPCAVCGGEGMLYNDNPPAKAWECHACDGEAIINADEAERMASFAKVRDLRLVVVPVDFEQDFDDSDIPL